MLHSIKQTVFKRLSFLDEHTLEVFTKSSSSMIVRISGVGVGFIVSVALGRTIGPDGLGIINLSNKAVSLLMIVVMLGMNNVVRKEVAIAYEQENWHHVANTIYTALVVNIPLAIGISVIALLATPWLTTEFFNEPELKMPLIIAICVIVPHTLSRIYAMGINGFRKIWQSNLVDGTLSQVVIAIGLLALWLFEIEITIINVALLYGLGKLVVMIAVRSYWKKIFSFSSKRERQTKKMLKVALPLLLVSATGLITNSSDTIMLGWLSNSKEIGFYSVASSIAMTTSFFHLLTASVLTPKVASLYGEDKIIELEIMIQRVTVILIFIGITSTLVFAIFGEKILQIWGNEFVVAYWVLLILAVGQTFNIGTGATGVILIMTGNERTAAKISLLTLILNLTLNYLLIPNFGSLGAAISTATTVIISNILKIVFVWFTTGVNTIPLKLFKKYDL